MDLLSLAAASRKNLSTNATAAPARRNIWGGDADVDQLPSDGQYLRREFVYNYDNNEDNHDGDPEIIKDEEENDGPESGGEDNNELDSEQDDDKLGNGNGKDEPDDEENDPEEEDEESSGRPRQEHKSRPKSKDEEVEQPVPKRTESQLARTVQTTKDDALKCVKIFECDIPFHEHAFYPSTFPTDDFRMLIVSHTLFVTIGGAAFNILRKQQKITAIILAHADQLSTMRKTLKREFVMQHIIARIPAGDCCRYDPKRRLFYPITEFEATTRIVQKLRDKRKRDDGAVPFRNFAFYPGTCQQQRNQHDMLVRCWTLVPPYRCSCWRFLTNDNCDINSGRSIRYHSAPADHDDVADGPSDRVQNQ
jgi:hypothetical protein